MTTATITTNKGAIKLELFTDAGIGTMITGDLPAGENP